LYTVKRHICFASLFLFIGLFPLQLWGQESLDIQFSARTQSLQDIIYAIENQTQTVLSYSMDKLPIKQNVKLKKRRYTIEKLLDEVCNGSLCKYTKKDQNKFVLVQGQVTTKEEQIIPKVISGVIFDASTGEPLIGATVSNQAFSRGVITNEIGLFRYESLSNQDSFLVSHVGFTSQLVSTEPLSDMMNIGLNPSITVDEIVIASPNAQKLESESTFNHYLNKRELAEGFGLLGSDPMNHIMHLSGIHSGREGQNSVYVRGGSPDQNLILMDGVALYETSHVLGLSSIFNIDAVKNVQVYKHAYPSKYGGRLSSIIDFKMKEGNRFERKSSVSISPLSINLTSEGPIAEGTTSYTISARKSLVNLFLDKPIEDFLDLDDSDLSFYDVNAKLTHEFSKGSKLFINAYSGWDKLEFLDSENIDGASADLSIQNFDRINWGSQVGSIQWHKSMGQKLFGKFSASLSNYDYTARSAFQFDLVENGLEEETALDIIANSTILDLGFQSDFQLFLNNKLNISFGAGMFKHAYNPTIRQSNIFLDGTQQEFTNNAPVINSNEYFAYTDFNIKPSNATSIKLGSRVNRYEVRDKTYWSLEPRITLVQALTDRQSFAISATKMTQFVHLLVNPGIGLPSELWIPTTDKLPPENAYQLSLNYINKMGKGWEIELGAYYKDMNNVIEYTSPFDLFFTFINNSDIQIKFDASRSWENFVQTGESSSRGAEFSLRKTTGKLQFESAYVISNTERQFDEINDGVAFPYKYDRTHDISMSTTFKFSEKLNVHAQWVYGTGDAFTAATEQFQSIDQPFLNSTGRNNFRLPAYHRLDLGIQMLKELQNDTRLTLDLSLFNVYNRKNTYYTYLFENRATNLFEFRKVSLFPIIPHFEIKLNF